MDGSCSNICSCEFLGLGMRLAGGGGGGGGGAGGGLASQTVIITRRLELHLYVNR